MLTGRQRHGLERAHRLPFSEAAFDEVQAIIEAVLDEDVTAIPASTRALAFTEQLQAWSADEVRDDETGEATPPVLGASMTPGKHMATARVRLSPSGGCAGVEAMLRELLDGAKLHRGSFYRLDVPDRNTLTAEVNFLDLSATETPREPQGGGAG